VQEELPDALPERRPSRLARGQDVAPVRAEPLDEQARLGRLARAVEALEGHEHWGLG